MSGSFVVLMFLVIMVPVFAISMFMPYWTRRTESFGVSIPERVYNTSELRALRKSYLFRVSAISLIVTVLFLAIGVGGMDSDEAFSWLFGSTLVLYLVGSFLIYLQFHNKMKAMKKQQQWQKDQPQRTVVDTSFREEKLTYSNGWFLVPFILSIVTFIVTFNFYDQIPDRIPMNYNFEGDVTNWVDKTYRSVMLMPAMQLFMTVLFLFVNVVIARAKQQVSAENPEESKRQNIVFRRRWSLFIIFGSVGMVALFGFAQASFIFDVPGELMLYVPIIFGGLITIASVLLAFTTGQGGSRVHVTQEVDGKVIDRDDDRYWKLGQFYFNKNDPAIFLEKRFGVGWTVNLARPLAWVIFALIIGIALLLPMLLGA
ncbi:DUF1648 domain-containing protein [Halobacillus salinus]|uniref:DUF1648 domain-containing protein n=1 Tax=Halobacillus salinus TaxID=192814 RepID=A0A4Z0GZH6_9BACI|nr:DUF5808 domain-containing protein [Halobacillus salinus]TGB02785.1 DUF1648 domain-containing protein [Halobacillus salinus]